MDATGVTLNPGSEAGRVAISILRGDNDIEKSNYGSGSFKMQNWGNNPIAGIIFDCTGSLLPGAIFDISGNYGDTAYKSYDPVEYLSSGTSFSLRLEWEITQDASNLVSDDPSTYYFYSEQDLMTQPAFVGFNNGASVGAPKALIVYANVPSEWTQGQRHEFSIDMDPYSISGFTKAAIDEGANWDVGGISGAEMSGSRVCALFMDGQHACAQLLSDGSNAGSSAFIATDRADKEVTIEVATSLGVYTQGQTGGFDVSSPVESISLSGTSGDRVRVMVVRGIQPAVNPYAPEGELSIKEKVDGRLAALFAAFPANNFNKVDTFDIFLDSNGQKTLGASELQIQSDDRPIGIIAAVVEIPSPSEGVSLNDEVYLTDKFVPVGKVTDPVYLLNTP